MIHDTEKLVKRAEAHKKSDRFRQNYGYFSRLRNAAALLGGRKRNRAGQYKGCAIGCLAMPVRNFAAHLPASGSLSQEDALEALQGEFGIPRSVVLKAEEFFENLPWNSAQVWPVRFAKALRDGTDLTLVSMPWLDVSSNADARRFLRLLRNA